MQNIDRIPFPHLMDEMKSYGKRQKAEMLYHKCIRLGKHDLAEKIARKYGIKGYKEDDTIMAFGLALSSSRFNF